MAALEARSGVAVARLVDDAADAMYRGYFRHVEHRHRNDRVRILVLAGHGNNGNDGRALVRRHLVDASLVDVVASAARRGGVDNVDDATTTICGADVVVDALIGRGVRLPIRRNSSVATWMQALARVRRRGCLVDAGAAATLEGTSSPSSPSRRPRVVAIDVPSGIDASSGAVDEELAVHADVTLAIHAAAWGLVAGGDDARLRVGELRVVRMSLLTKVIDTRSTVESSPLSSSTNDKASTTSTATSPPSTTARSNARPPPLLVTHACLRSRDDAAIGHVHKLSAGVTLIIGGGGAAAMAARGAVVAGASYVVVWSGRERESLSSTSSSSSSLSSLPSTLSYLADLPEVIVATDDDVLDVLRRYERRLGAVVIGPGLGTGVASTSAFLSTLAFLRRHAADALGVDASLAARHRHRRPLVVIDADALTMLALQPRMASLLPPRTVLTPHVGEARRLGLDDDEANGDDVDVDADDDTNVTAIADRVTTLRRHARRLNTTLLAKGAFAVVANGGGRVLVSAASTTLLATAGSGDFLNGVIVGIRDVVDDRDETNAEDEDGEDDDDVDDDDDDDDDVAAIVVDATLVVARAAQLASEAAWSRGVDVVRINDIGAHVARARSEFQVQSMK